jgi:integrase
MNNLKDALEEYLITRRALGTKYKEPEQLLEHFVEFLEFRGEEFITTKWALCWAQEPKEVQRATWARRLGMVRGFAGWMSALDPRTEIPSRGLINSRIQRNKPYIYSDQEIEKLMVSATKLKSPTGLRAISYEAFIGLLVSTGLRPGEALNLERPDVNLQDAILTIRNTKFGKSRYVPISDSTCIALKNYAKKRDAIFPESNCSTFLISEQGKRIYGAAARYTFSKLSCSIGLRNSLGVNHIGHGPRLMDFRHTLATRKIIEWYRNGLDINREMFKLSTYLGHSETHHTYWYIEAIPELLQLATERMTERKQGGENE